MGGGGGGGEHAGMYMYSSVSVVWHQGLPSIVQLHNHF